MKRRWRRGVVLAAVGAAAVVAGVLLATQPWSDGETAEEEAAGDTVEHRLCDVVVDAPLAAPVPGQDWLVVGRGVSRTGEAARELQPTLELQVRGPIDSRVSINPRTGSVLEEFYGAPAHEAILREILQTLRVEHFDPATAPWPYTDAVQISQDRSGYRPPDPGSGLVVSTLYEDGIGSFARGLKVANCRSVMEILTTFRTGAEPEVTVTKDIHPDDAAAFQTFLDEVTVWKLAQ